MFFYEGTGEMTMLRILFNCLHYTEDKALTKGMEMGRYYMNAEFIRDAFNENSHCHLLS